MQNFTDPGLNTGLRVCKEQLLSVRIILQKSNALIYCVHFSHENVHRKENKYEQISKQVNKKL